MADQDNSPEAFVKAMQERKIHPAKRAKSLPDDFASRPFGAAFLALALLAFWLYTYTPIADAQAHAASISYSSWYVIIQPLFTILGIAYLVFGASCSKVLGPTTQPSSWGWVLAGLCVLLGFIYLYYVKTYLQSLGYTHCFYSHSFDVCRQTS